MTPTIKNSCPENWDKMSPENQGRFCSACAKIVVDFTKKTTDEIIDFLSGNKNEEICGRVKKSALVPVRVKSGMKLFAAALYFVFGSFLFTSCGPDDDEEVMGKMCVDTAVQTIDSTNKVDSGKTTTHQDDSLSLDSAKVMSTMNILDSIAALKNK